MAFLSAQASPGLWAFSSGSTGTPAQFFWSTLAHREMLRAKYRFLAMWGIDILDRTAYLWGHTTAFQPGLAGLLARVRQPVLDWLRNRIRLPAYRLGHDDLRGYLRRLAAFRPTSIYAYTSAAYLLAQEAAAAGFRLDSLKAAVLSAEPVFPHVARTIEKAFAVPAVIEYGSAEGGVMAMEWPDRTLRVREDCVLLETVPQADGRFDILLTPLNNPSFPLLRYAIGDSTDAALNVPERGFAILGGLVGRKNDLIVSRTGRPLHPIWFDEIFSRNAACSSGVTVDSVSTEVMMSPTDRRVHSSRGNLRTSARQTRP
jgi:phenylacetate-coenzyme A ligase PaaK-like adenylate-forming protein